LLLSAGVFWYIYTKPTAITGYIHPSDNEPFPSNIPSGTWQPVSPTPPAEPIDTRSWGERFRDPAIPDVPGITWQTYTNKEYGFEMEYPKGTRVEIMKDFKNTGVVWLYFNFYNDMSGMRAPITFGGIMSIRRGTLDTLRNELMRSAYWVNRINTRGFIPDATRNGIDMFIETADEPSGHNVPSVNIVGGGYVYQLSESYESQSEETDKITEHIIKTFRFLK